MGVSIIACLYYEILFIKNEVDLYILTGKESHSITNLKKDISENME